MNLLKLTSMLCVIAPTGTFFAQVAAPSVLIAPARIVYPPIGRAAHVEGDVSVHFSIDSDGRTVSVQATSGPEMLRVSVEAQIKQWRFPVPLPMNAQSDFEGTYKFSLHEEDEDLDDDLDGPPFVPCCGDSISLVSGAKAEVTDDLHSLDGSQTIGPAPIVAVVQKDSCPDDKEKRPPPDFTATDFVELDRSGCKTGCIAYRIRVYRYGRVEWNGTEDVAVKGERAASINPEIADAVVAKFQTESYWGACAAKLSSNAKPNEDDGENNQPDYFNVSISGHTKSVNLGDGSFAHEDAGIKLAWAIDKAADTHRWRHGDSINEHYTNMIDDLKMPKPGITALMRATYRFSSRTGGMTLEPLKHLLAKGVDVDAADESGWTALMYAAQLNSSDGRAVQLLLEAHANVDRASLHGDTAFMMAAYSGYLEEKLLAAGADINARNADGVTALMLLAQHGNPDELKEAIVAGADASVQDKMGRTALDYLRAASCEKPLITMPVQWGYILSKEPVSCPSKAPSFLKSEAILQGALKKASTK